MSIHLEFSSELAAPPEELWRHAGSMAGHEPSALFASIADALGAGQKLVPGRTVFHSFGCQSCA